MAYLTKKQVTEIIRKAPPGTSPAGIVAALRQKGHQLEGYEEQGVEAKTESYNPLKEAAQPFIGAAKGAASTLYNIGKLAMKRDKVIGLDKAYGSPQIPEGKPEALKAKGVGQKIGYVTEQAAEFLLPGGAISKGEKAVQTATKAASQAGKITPLAQKVLNIAGGAALEGVGAGAVATAQSGSVKEGAKTGVIASVLSVPFKIFGQIKEPVSKALQKSAEKKSAQALGATTKANKELSEKVVPELLRRRVLFGSREGLLSKTQSSIDDVGGQLEGAYSALPEGTKVDIAPVLNTLEKFKDEAVVLGEGGQRVVVDAAKYRAAQDMQKTILEIAKDPSKSLTNLNVSVESLRAARQILDKSIARTGKSFALGAKDSAVLASQKQGANAIRNELAQEFPNIAKINKEYTFWKNVETVVKSTVERTKSQATPLGETIAEGAGATIGAVKGGSLGNVVLGAIGYKLLKKVITSPAWRQTSAVLRSMLADSLMRGNKEQAIAILNRISAGLLKQATSD